MYTERGLNGYFMETNLRVNVTAACPWPIIGWHPHVPAAAQWPASSHAIFQHFARQFQGFSGTIRGHDQTGGYLPPVFFGRLFLWVVKF